MCNHPIKKSAGLLVLYSVIIVGIFVLQFRSESVITRNIGLLRMSVDQTQGKNGKTTLKNRMLVSFKGISFTADDVHPAVLLTGGNPAPHHLTLVSWEQASPLSFRFNFTKDTSVTFAVSDASADAALTISVQLPERSDSLTMMYKPATGYSVTDQTKTKVIVSSKNAEYTMRAPLIQNDYISFARNEDVATYSKKQAAKSFTFDTITPDIPLADRTTFNATVRQINTALVTAAQSAMLEPLTLTEQAVTAYVAEMANTHRYAEAISSVPESFKKGTKRTYISAPFFNSLVNMNASLERQIENTSRMVQNALDQKSFDVFCATDIVAFMIRNNSSPSVLALAALPAKTTPFTPTLTQAAGILNTFAGLKEAASPLADALEPALDNCIKIISSNCKKNGEKLQLYVNDAQISVVDAVDTGCALVHYGNCIKNTTYSSAGYLIVNSALAGNAVTDLRTLTAIYPVLSPENTFYPHTLILGKEQERTIWAWTVAHSISYTLNESHTEADISITFPEGDSHYVIIKGIQPFSAIDIYEMPFRTDPRFETYNSSGYVYNPENHTLFLKSRHKSSTEVIRLHYPRGIENANSASTHTEEHTVKEPAKEKEEPASQETNSESDNTETESSATDYEQIPEAD